MTNPVSIARKRCLIAASAVIALVFAFGTFSSARAEDHRWDRREHHGWEYRGGPYYYPRPPVVYGPGYYPPPVVYGPGVGVSLPGVSIGIR